MKPLMGFLILLTIFGALFSFTSWAYGFWVSAAAWAFAVAATALITVAVKWIHDA